MSDYVADLFPPEVAFQALPISVQREAEHAGEWLVDRIAQFSPSVGYVLGSWDRWMLQHSVFDLMRRTEQESQGSLIRAKELDREYRQAMTACITGSVYLVRQAIEADKKKRVQTVVTRPGLRIPTAWEDRYELIYETGLPWTISAVMQNAFMGNPLAGEKRPWRSR